MFKRFVATFFIVFLWGQVDAQPGGAGLAGAGPDRAVAEWLARNHEAGKRRAYQGTFAISSSFGMSSGKIWHVCDGQQQMERVDALTGPPRTTLRHNQQVISFSPESKTARVEQRATLGLMPSIDPQSFASVAEFYTIKPVGSERVAGVEADVVLLQARDSLRYTYRIWSERKTGLVVKVQTLDDSNRVLEQAAFSEVQLDAPVRMDQLSAQMKNPQGFRMERDDLVKTTAAAEGWSLRSPVPGFKASGCHKRGTNQAGAVAESMQWVFTDGLATVSLFVEPFDAKRHRDENIMSLGATHSMSRKVDAGYWLIAMGEVPVVTLRAFASALQRR